MRFDGTPDWWRYAREVWTSDFVWPRGPLEDRLDLAWRMKFGVSRLQVEEEVERFDAGEVGTLIRYESGRCACVNLYGGAEIRIRLRGV